MKPYGVKRKDAGCCPGHDKYPTECYSQRPSTANRRNMDRGRKKSARQAGIKACQDGLSLSTQLPIGTL